MEILWIAIVFYSIGLGLALHFRPDLMFNENGTWKEFGYQRSKSRYTVFPFWLFALTWAFMSYVLALSLSWFLPVASSVAAIQTFGSKEEVEVEEEVRRGPGRPRKVHFDTPINSVVPSPAPAPSPSVEVEPKPRSGYYVLDPASEEGGLRRYIYYGDKAPSD